jgi:hypothetical protein
MLSVYLTYLHEFTALPGSSKTKALFNQYGIMNAALFRSSILASLDWQNATADTLTEKRASSWKKILLR